ncbi:MAG: hypothetical protein QNJ71_10215 [Acidimicrobiia bacterium]|nr:hypothetical protein [Acidimicrobiia bacterium]
MADYTVPVTFRMVGLQELKEANNELKRMSGSTGNVARATKSTARFGNVAQNAGYQVQDFIVQVQSGQDPMRALGQQLPQLTVGMGAWGAAIGVVAAALPALISAMSDTNEKANDLETSLGNLNESLGDIGKTFQTLDLSNYVEQYLQADEATQQLMKTTLEYQKLIATLDLNEAVNALPAIPTRSPGTGGRTRGAAFESRFDKVAESLGLTAEQLRQTAPLFEALRKEETRTLEVAQQLNEELAQFALNGDIRNSNLRDTIETTREFEQALRILTSAEKEFSKEVETQTDKLLQEIEVIGKRREAIKFETDTDENLGFDTRDFVESEGRLQDNQWLSSLEDVMGIVEEAPEAFSLAAEGAEIFARSFDRAITGVAQGTQDLSDAFKNMVQVILVELGKLAAYQFLANLFPGTAFGNAAGSLLPSANGNVFSGGEVVPFAKGGVVNSPTIFPMANGAGLMGEAGPEAILPLRRNSRGQLGVQSEPMNVIVNNNAPGVSVNPRQSDGQLTLDIVMANVAASIDRGGNAVSTALERNYTLSRGRGAY